MDDMDHAGKQSEGGSSPLKNGHLVREIWIVAVKYRLIVLGSMIGAGVLAAIISLLIPNQYTAIATILPPQQNSSMSGMLSAEFGGIASLGLMAGKDLGLKDPNDPYIGMLESRVVEDAMVNKFNLQAVYDKAKMSKARKALENHSAILSTKTGYISISVEDRDPNRAAEMANAYVQLLQALNSNFAVTEAGQRGKFFEQQLQDAQTKLVAAQQQLKETQQQTGVLELESQMRTVIESVAGLKAEIAAKEVEMEALSSYATAENPQRVMAQQELTGLQKQLAILMNRPTGKGDLQVPTSQIPAIGITYLNRLRDVRYYEAILELMAKQVELARIDQARQGSILQILDPAIPPDTKSFPSRTLITVLAAFLGLMGSIAFLVLRELSSSAKANSADAAA